MATVAINTGAGKLSDRVLRSASDARWLPYGIIILGAFAARAITFGNPTLDYDEQLYLLIGDRLLHGHLPYVELWDRKPIGLFLFYALVRSFGGVGIIQYQVAATLCVAATACLIVTMARRAAGPVAATVAGLGYILMLDSFHGAGGQAPVIYNVLTALAAWCAFRSNDTDDRSRIIGLALAAMAAIGIAIQFKYTPGVEGMFFGLYFLWRLRTTGSTVPRLALPAAMMGTLALLPTAAAIAFYAADGHLAAFVQANFFSIFQRRPFPVETSHLQILLVIFFGAVVIVLTPSAMIEYWETRADRPHDRVLMLGWGVAAFVGFGLLGNFYDFYFITVLLPLCILIAATLKPGRSGFANGCLLLFWPIVSLPHYYFKTEAYRNAAMTLATAVRPYVGSRCLYVYDGPTILYLLTNSCSPTRFIYPDHLTNPTETPALGVDAVAEEKRLLATRPGAIVTADQPLIPRVDPATQRLVRDAIAKDYVLTARVNSPDRTFYVWALRALNPSQPPIVDPQAAIPF